MLIWFNRFFRLSYFEYGDISNSYIIKLWAIRNHLVESIRLVLEILVKSLLLIRRCIMSPLAVDAAVAVLVAVLDVLDED